MEYGYGECARCGLRFKKRMHNHTFCAFRCWQPSPRRYVPAYEFTRTDELLSAHREGATVKELAKVFGVSWQRIHAILRRAGAVDSKVKMSKHGCP